MIYTYTSTQSLITVLYMKIVLVITCHIACLPHSLWPHHEIFIPWDLCLDYDTQEDNTLYWKIWEVVFLIIFLKQWAVFYLFLLFVLIPYLWQATPSSSRSEPLCLWAAGSGSSTFLYDDFDFDVKQFVCNSWKQGLFYSEFSH